MLCCAEKLSRHPEIFEKNLSLFARMIKFETLIRNIQTKIEKERYEVTKKLKALKRENEHSPMSKARHNWFSNSYSMTSFQLDQAFHSSTCSDESESAEVNQEIEESKDRGKGKRRAFKEDK